MTARVQVSQVSRPAPRPRVPVLSIGQQMREAREASGMTRKAVARRLFVTTHCLTNWELGHRTPSVPMLDAYLKIVGATIVLGATT